MRGCCAAAVCILLVLHPGSPAWGLTLCLHGSAPRGSAAFVGSQLLPHEQCLSTCISAFLSQLPGAHPSCRERLGGGRGDGGGSDEKAGEMGVKGCRCFLGEPQGVGEEAPGVSWSVLVGWCCQAGPALRRSRRGLTCVLVHRALTPRG